MSEPRPVRAIIVPTSDDEPMTLRVVDASRAGLPGLVGGGQPEVVPLRQDGTVLYVDAYGKSKGLPRNARATRLADALLPGFADADTINGPAVFTGTDPDDGGPADLPAATAHAAGLA